MPSVTESERARPFSALRFRLPEIALLVFCLLLFARTATYPFLFDDTSIVADNRLIESPGNIPRIFASSYWEGTEMGDVGGLYRPVTIAFYAIERLIFGKDPTGYHVVNVLLHALLSLLVYRFFAGLIDRRLAWIGAALFAVHPVHVEAVAGIVGQAETLSAGLVLAALLVHKRWRPPAASPEDRTRGERGRTRQRPASAPGAAARSAAPWLAGTLYLAAILTKESSLAAIGLVAAYEIVFRTGGRFGAWFRRLPRDLGPVYGPWIAAAAVALAARYAALGFVAKADPIHQIDNPLLVAPFAARFPTGLRIFAEYVRLAVFPLKLSMDYSLNQIPVSTWSDAPVWIGAALAASAAGGIVAAARRRSPLLFPALWCLATYALIANVFVLIGTVVAERLLYLPSAGFCMLLAVPLARRRLHARRTAAIAAIAIVLGLFGARSWTRAAQWRSEDDVILHDVKSAPQSARIRSAYARILFAQGRTDEALREFDRTLEIAPQFGEPYLYKATAALAAGDRASAASYYIKAIHLIPSYLADYEREGRPALGLDLGEAMRLYNEGAAALKRSDTTAATLAFTRALELAPDPESARQLSALLLLQNRAEEALSCALRSIQWDPGNGEGHWLASGAYFALGDWERSRDEAEQAFRLGYAVPPEILARLRRGR